MKKVLHIILLVIAVAIIAVNLFPRSTPSVQLQGRDDCEFSETTTATSSIATSSATQLLSLNRNRCYAYFQNCGNSDITLSLGTSTTAGNSFVLATSTSRGDMYEILAKENPHIGPVYAIASSSVGCLRYGENR